MRCVIFIYSNKVSCTLEIQPCNIIRFYTIWNLKIKSSWNYYKIVSVIKKMLVVGTR